ncbi:restriction endonuclease subunit S [Empedobacter falsenii]
MSKLDELLRGVDVEFLPLGEIANFLNGKGHEKAISDDGKYIVVNSKFVSSEGKIIKYSDVQIVPLYIDDILIVMSDLPNGKALAKTFLVEDNNKYTLNQRIGRISVKNKNALLPKYLNYILNRSSELLKFNNGVDQTNLKKNQILEVSIPIPCPDNPEKSLEIQQEIVRVLDELTSLTNQLTTELETERQNRKKQFEFFREQLFRFEDGKAVWYKLDEVSIKISSGGTPKTSMPNYYNGNIPWLRTQEVGNGEIWDTDIKITELGLKNSSAKYIPINSIIIAMYGATVGKVGINKIPLTTNQACANIEVNPEILFYKFLYYYLKSKYQYIKSLGTGPQTNINAGIVKSLLIPIPPLEEQERIVKLLDQFDATHTAIEEEITKEIKLRTQQYEYYREKLLSFPL